MSWFLIIFLLIIGLLLLLLEVLVIPGTSIAGIFGFLSMVVGVWMAFTSYGTASGLITLGSVLVISIVTFILAFRSKTWDRISLKTSIDSKIDTFDDILPKAGETAVAISRLNPIGKVEYDGKEYEARSISGYIEEKSSVIIVAIESNKLIVKHQN
ncbi:MAG TPA: NfeD family protein [Salinivirgaceae bacterium]|nr:NfeD family protein [Salinivirgaceae bacterium]